MKNLISVIAFIACMVSGMPSGAYAADGARVKITTGQIEGSADEGIFAFKGIPYAKAERFMLPEKADNWSGVRECKNFGPWAKQTGPEGQSVEGEGDFLINVWTAGLNDHKKRPIMVWIHGGGFSTGSSNMSEYFDGASLAKKGVVLMSINHRLDIMGFLDLSSFGGKYKDCVNVGMFDIIAALEWVRDNAEAFGGDAGNVTIFGESGGGGKVGTLMCMPQAAGLFHKAIIESGAKVNITDQKISQSLAEEVVKELGITSDNLDKLKDVDFEELVRAGRKCSSKLLGPRTPGTVKMWGFVPTCDGKTLPRQPYTPGFNPISKNIPVIIGSTFNELDRVYYSDKEMTEQQAEAIARERYGDKADEYIKAFAEAYPNHSPQDLVSIDSNIRALSVAAADSKANEKGAPVYMFLFSWMSSTPQGSVRGSFHALELPFVFNNTEMERGAISPTDRQAQALAEKMSDAWVSFAKTGDPNTQSLPRWERYDPSKGAVMIFDNRCEMKYDFDHRLQNFLTTELK